MRVSSVLTLAEYLDRPVWSARMTQHADFEDLSVDGLAILALGSTSRGLPLVIESILQGSPVALWVAGDAELLGVLLERLSGLEGPHVMTGRVGEVDALEEFLLAAIPSEERFDEWRGYLLLDVSEG